MKLSKTLMHTTAIMLLGTSVVYADSMTKETSWDLDADGRIESLPQTGTVSLSGTVASVSDEDTFTLKDKSGETIDVHTTETISFVEGARVKVQGQITDEAMGLGEEIKASSVNVLNSNKTAAVEADSKAGLQVGESEGVGVDIQASVTREQPKSVKGEKAEQNAAARRDNSKAEVASYDLDADVDADNIEARPEAETGAKDATEMAATLEGDSIDNLPKQGRITLTGTVDDIDGSNKFTLRDANGETIDVNTATNLTVAKGDRVKVMGQVKSEFAGLGREIQATDVMSVR